MNRQVTKQRPSWPTGDASNKGNGSRGGSSFHNRRRHRWRYLLVIPGLIFALFAWSLVGAALTPGNTAFKAKWADWLRSHHAAIVASHLEQFYYSHTQPPKGGQPKHLNPLPAKDATAATTTPVAKVPPHLPPPSPVPLVVKPALPGEGQWQPVGSRVDGIPGMYEAQFRADKIYTGEITSAVWIDPLLLNIALHPGSRQPGGTWPTPPYITNAERASVVAAFNGGFRMQDAQGGFYLYGHTQVPLRTGAASLVIYKNGTVNIGAWGSQVVMTPNVAAVLQNLVPLVNNGKIAASATYNDTSVWGATLGAKTVVARSGIGITSDGALVYVAGPALTARSLAESLQRVGAVRAMTLDMNPYWVTFNFFGHPNPANPAQLAPSKLYPQMQRSATRYLGPTLEARDFFTLSLPKPA